MAKKKTPKDAVDFTASAAGVDIVAKQVSLLDICLINSHAFRIVGDDYPEDLAIQDRFTTQVIEHKPVKKTFGVLWEFGVRGLDRSEGAEEREIFKIEATFRLTYKLKTRKGVTKKDIISFATVNSVVHIWPFWREFVHNQTSRMALPVLTVGLRAPRKGLAELIQQEKKSQLHDSGDK